jgi:putative transferase (TIGR04331 family)
VGWRFGEKIKYKINQKWRNKYIGKKIDNLLELCMAISHIYLPVSFLEGFNPLYKISLLYEFKYLYTSVGTINNTPLKMVAATWHGNSKIFNQQHGGSYGMHKINWSEIYERSIADNFFTLGWKEDIKTIPLSARPRIVKNSKSSGILIKTKPNHKYLDDFFSESLNQTIKFITSTKGLNREISHYRTQPGETSDNDYYVRLTYKLANATIPDKTKNEGLYLLHVLNYMGTCFLESMAADIPTICILDNNYSFYRPAYRKYIDELREVGIIQPDGQSAADKVNDIYHDIDSWWLDVKLQKVRRSFTQNNARLNSNWINELCEQFERIIK